MWVIQSILLKFPQKRKINFQGFCPNCEHPVHGKFCPNCGQSTKDFHRPFWRVVSDSAGDAFSFDNKFFHTLIPLFTKPGFLTREFMRGRRVRYTPPFRLYLFFTFFAFLLLQHNHKPETEMAKNLTFKTSAGETVDLMVLLAEEDEEEGSKETTVVLDRLKGDTTKKGIINLEQPKIQKDSLQSEESTFSESDLKTLLDMWRLNPSLMMDNVFKKLSQALLLVLPLFALCIALFYIRRKHYFIEHLLISLNFHSFIFGLVIASELLLLINSPAIDTFALYLYVLIPIQLFLTLKFYYKQSWIKTFVKFFMLSFVYNIMLASVILYSLISLID